MRLIDCFEGKEVLEGLSEQVRDHLLSCVKISELPQEVYTYFWSLPICEQIQELLGTLTGHTYFVPLLDFYSFLEHHDVGPCFDEKKLLNGVDQVDYFDYYFVGRLHLANFDVLEALWVDEVRNTRRGM